MFCKCGHAKSDHDNSGDHPCGQCECLKYTDNHTGDFEAWYTDFIKRYEASKEDGNGLDFKSCMESAFNAGIDSTDELLKLADEDLKEEVKFSAMLIGVVNKLRDQSVYVIIANENEKNKECIVVSSSIHAYKVFETVKYIYGAANVALASRKVNDIPLNISEFTK